VVLSANGESSQMWFWSETGKSDTPKARTTFPGTRRKRLIRLSVGKDATTATARRLQKEAELNAVNHGVTVLPDGQNGNRSVAVAVADFLDETKLTKKPKTLSAYTTALNYFTESCPKLYLEDIDRRDLLKFAAFLRDEKEQAPALCLQQVRERDDVSEGERDSRSGRKKRLASVHRRRA
jgi:hypothetical protein